MKTLLAVIATLSMMSGCTVVGAVAGGTSATHHNSDRNQKLERGEYGGTEESVTNAVLSGAVVGFLVDAAVMLAVSQMHGNNTEHISLGD